MKNKLFLSIFFFIISFQAYAENLLIQAKKISIDKNNEISIFEGKVVVTTQDQDKIKGNYAKYNRKLGLLIIKSNVVATDAENNIIKAEYAEYNEKLKLLKSRGPTKIITNDKYIISGSDIVANDKDKTIASNNKAIVTDIDNNKISLENFKYQKLNNIFKSFGYIVLEDNKKNIYELSQIYIDTKKKEIIGTDSKFYLNNEDIKDNQSNKPRIFSNTVKLNDKEKMFEKSIFTTCDYRENDKCPPWSIQSKKMSHDSSKKTIYYDHAVVKLYDIPIFYFPKFAHPDPTVDRRSGFLPPTFSNTKNLGMSTSIPYFWAINDDKNFTITNRLFKGEHPLLHGEYHQAFKSSNFLADLGYTKGFKTETTKKKRGDKSHFFSRYTKNFESKKSESYFKLNVENVSDDKYLKLYKLKSDLVDYEKTSLQNEIDFTYDNDNFLLGLNASVFQTLKENYNDKYEYILPEIIIDKNIFNNQLLGSLDLSTNFKSHKYNTNTTENFLVNDLNWNSIDINTKYGLKNKFLSSLRNINYEVKNFKNETQNYDIYKKDTTSEIHGALGFKSEISLKRKRTTSEEYFTPKIFLRYAPGNMRKEIDGSRMDVNNAFNINRTYDNKNFETGLSSTVGFDYNYKKNNKDFDFSIAQIINEKENKKLHDKTSLNEKVSDLMGSANFKANENLTFDYNFNIDQNYNEINYNELGINFDTNRLNFNFDYLQEDKHIAGENKKEYFKTKIDFAKSSKTIFSFSNKRSLVTNSSEFYNLSYEYLNDCLRAGIVYRREFYTDSELEPEDSLMFKITFTPFGEIQTPSFREWKE